MKKYFLFVTLNLFLINSIISAQSYAIQRGHTNDDLYIYCRKNATSNSVMQFYYLWEHGQRISVQYTIPYPATDNDLNLKNLVADPTTGMLFCTSIANADTSIYQSVDYGKTWQHLPTLFNGLTPPIALLGGSVAGEIIMNERPSAAYYSIGSTSDFFASHIKNTQYTSYFAKPEVGVYSGEIYGINNAYSNNWDFLLHSSDFGVTIDTILIDSLVVYNPNGNLAHKVCHGILAGEIFLVTLEPAQTGYPNIYRIYHSTDYGSTYTFQSEIKLDESSSYTDFTGGRLNCSFYVVNWKFSQQLQRQILQVFYSSDCCQTFTLYEHDLDSFVNVDEFMANNYDRIVIFPNPSSEKLCIQTDAQIEGSLFTMFDMQGHVILNQNIYNTNQQFNISTLPIGTYPWRIVSKNKVKMSGKWVKE